jgi:dual specificity phosphatase 12
MQQTIDAGELEGKLECPKCRAKVGTYAWQGMRCSCGKWVTPSFSLGKSKVDEVKRVAVVTTGNTVVTKPMVDGGDTVKSKV